MNLGSSEVLALRVGNEEVVAAYLGSALVWTSGFRFDGALLSTTALSGAIQVARPINGLIAAAATIGGAMGARRPLAGSVVSSSEMAGEIGVFEEVIFNGALEALSGLAGVVSVSRALSGSVASLSSISGTAVLDRVLSGAAAALSTLVGTAKVRRALSGAMGSVSSSGSALTIVPSTIVLTQKGYGHAATASDTGSLALSYANVDAGSAPAAGDLVVWHIMTDDTGGSPIVDLTGSGWAQASATDTEGHSSGLAKVLTAGDISSPPTVVVGPTLGAGGQWVAYSVSGVISTVSIGGMSFDWSSSAAPANRSLNLSALTGPLIASSQGTGSDGSVLQAWSGATADGTNANVNLFASNLADITHMWKRYASGVAGDNITVSKGDDGSFNSLGVFYVQVS